MNCKTKTYDFKKELKERAGEMEESLLQGSSPGLLVVNKNNFELMDGYTRYTVLKKQGEKETYAYLGEIKEL